MSHPKGLGRVCWRFISHYCTHTHFFPIFWLQINYLHSKIPPDSFVTEFKCDSSGKEKYFSTTVAKQFFLPSMAVLAKFHWACLYTFLPLFHPPHTSEGHLTFHSSWVIAAALPAVIVTAFHLFLQLCWTLSYINTSSNICKVLRDPSA